MLGFLGLFGLAMGGLVYLRTDEEDDDQAFFDATGDDGNQVSGLDQMLDASETTVLAAVEVDDTATELDTVNDYVPLDDGTQNDPRWIATVQTEGTDEDDTLSGDNDDNTMDGGRGSDAIDGKGGNDNLSGGNGDDTINAGEGNDVISGDAGDDTLTGGWGDDTLTGGDGRDTLFGGRGNDLLNGVDDNASPDFLNGGEGDDTIIAGRGDLMHGGDGQDRFVMQLDAGAQIADFDASADTIELTYDDMPPELTTQADDDGLILLADGTPAAHLLGVNELDLDSVVLTRAAQIAFLLGAR